MSSFLVILFVLSRRFSSCSSFSHRTQSCIFALNREGKKQKKKDEKSREKAEKKEKRDRKEEVDKLRREEEARLAYERLAQESQGLSILFFFTGHNMLIY